MIVTEFQLDRFRGGNPLRVLDLGDGLNVALVRSSAGRAQLLNVIPTCFYGPAPFFWEGDDEATARDFSGELVLRTDRGVFRIDRNAEDGRVQVHSPDGAAFTADALDELLDGVHLREYRDLFTFNLDRLRQLVGQPEKSVAKLERMAQFLWECSADAEQQETVALPAQQLDLSGPATAVDALYELLQKESTDQDGVPQNGHVDRDKLSRDLKKVDGSLGDLQNKIRHLEEEIDETRCALSINRGRTRLADIDREIAELTDVSTPQVLSSVAEGSIDRLDIKINECKQQLKQLSSEREELARQGRALNPDERRTSLRPQIEAMLVHEKSAAKEEEVLERLRLKLDDFQSRLEVERHDHSLHQSSLPVVDARSSGRVESLGERLQEAERAQEVAEQRLAHAETLALGIDAAHTGPMTRPEDAIALHEAELRVAMLRDQLTHDDRLHALEVDRAETIAQIRQLYQGQLMPFQLVMMLGVPFMVGVAMVIYGLTQYTPEPRWNMVGLGLVFAIGTAIFKMVLDRDNVDGLDRARGRLARIQTELSALGSEQGSDHDDIRRELAVAERGLAELQSHATTEAFVSLDVQRAQESNLSVEAARHEMESAQRRLRELNQQWRDLLSELGLPTTLTPDHAREAIADRALNQHTNSLHTESPLKGQLAATKNEIELRKDWLSNLAGKLRQLLKDVGLPAGGSITEQFQLLREAHQEDSERRQERRQLARAIRRVRQKAQQLQETGRRCVAQKRELLADADSKKSRSEIQRELRSDRRKLLQQQRELVEQDIDEIRQRHGIESRTPLEEFDDQELETRLADQLEKIENLREKQLRQVEKRGRLRVQLSSTGQEENGHAIGWQQLLQRTEDLRGQIEAAQQQRPQSKILKLPGRPEYLQAASEFLQLLSGGQFIGLDFDSETITITDHRQVTAGLQQTNPNHYPNIYFSLWLARLEAYADEGIRLPIIMEDPLEATRESRRAPVAEMLSDFASRGHQLVLVTSRADNARTFATMGVPIADFSKREPVEELFEDPQPMETESPVEPVGGRQA